MNEEGGVRGTEKSISTMMRFSTVTLDRSLKHFGLIFFQNNQYTIERKGIRIIKNERHRENSGGTSNVQTRGHDKRGWTLEKKRSLTHFCQGDLTTSFKNSEFL